MYALNLDCIELQSAKRRRQERQVVYRQTQCPGPYEAAFLCEHFNDITWGLEYEQLPLESSRIAFPVVSASRSLEKWPEPDPKSSTVLNFRLMSYGATVHHGLRRVLCVS